MIVFFVRIAHHVSKGDTDKGKRRFARTNSPSGKSAGQYYNANDIAKNWPRQPRPHVEKPDLIILSKNNLSGQCNLFNGFQTPFSPIARDIDIARVYKLLTDAAAWEDYLHANILFQLHFS